MHETEDTLDDQADENQDWYQNGKTRIINQYVIQN
jgi:hypothetical protein